MRRFLVGLLLLSAAFPAAADSERWLHLRVLEENGRRTRVEINLPHSVLVAAAPLIPDLDPEEACIRFNDADLTAADLRELVRAAVAAPELKSSSISHEDGTVSAFRKGDVLVIQTESKYFAEERSEVHLPLRVAAALVRRDDDMLDLRAAALELIRIGEGQLLFAADDDSMVKVWVDRVPAGVRRKR